ncbi:MAG: protein translocase SEC61 complex subunit gamma [Candidatus Caldarchaeales archaeon]|jgi:protein translocase SEC61 complex gamma subunit|nr:protein translocase SEC61 complex subunit gamma [Candidatus Caldarchaeales archaeon]
MGLKEFAKSVIVTLRVARKPTSDEFMVLARIVLIGVFLLGAISFIVRYLALALQGGL